MSKYVNNGENWFVFSDLQTDYKDNLPVGNYTLRQNEDTGQYYLVESSPFKVAKIYGDVGSNVDMVINTYLDRAKNTGVLAVGEKGSGKTLFTQLVSIEAAKKYKIPTIIIDTCYHGQTFFSFLENLKLPVIVLFDEFEKTYFKKDIQESLLTIFDGVHQSNKLFMFTANDEYSINECMLSRPGRIYYKLKYGNIDEFFIRDYCNDNLNDKSRIESIVIIAQNYGGFTFDKIKAVVEEMNRYNKDVISVLKHLNIDFSPQSDDKYYDFSVVTSDGTIIEAKDFNRAYVYFEPLTETATIDFVDKRENIILNPGGIIAVKNKGKAFVYKCNDYVITIKERFVMEFDINKHLLGVGNY